ncbi:hypothetical protein [Pontibacillus salipaludis]|uniref:DUF3221 domain-containing protein n=1 Tax=Pontibacillus salipaludis TaxID=1697394 RepID=A0ABQ1Q401_9BACI|nr:hypothetical protein [Pontibacillus salipaludis]GGD12864.1 hypothetical protein GCM10011389_20510 [Pontibacillus salipaludis]
MKRSFLYLSICLLTVLVACSSAEGTSTKSSLEDTEEVEANEKENNQASEEDAESNEEDRALEEEETTAVEEEGTLEEEETTSVKEEDTPVEENTSSVKDDSNVDSGSSEGSIGQDGQRFTSIDQVKTEIQYAGIGKNDTLEDLTFENGRIVAVINLAPHELFSAQDIAVNRYSQLSDHLLEFEGWDVLTIEYKYVGKVSFTRSQSESSEYGDYFPTLEIERQITGE